MASLFAQPLNNFTLPPSSALTAAINPAPAVPNGESKSSTVESSKKPKIVVRFKLKLNKTTTCDHDVSSAGSSLGLGAKKSGSDDEVASTSKPCPSSPPTMESTQATFVEPKKSVRAAAAKKRKEKEEKEKEKKQICITLSKEEIEQDIMAIRKLSGSRSLRVRPKKKKRSNTLQKQLDLLFPGWV